jgi:hypothetical protein
MAMTRFGWLVTKLMIRLNIRASLGLWLGGASDGPPIEV